MSSKFLLAVLAAFAVLFVVDWLWFGIIFKDWFMQRMPSNQESIPLHALGELCLAVLLAIAFPMGYKGGSAVMEGARFGLLMGLIYQLPGAIHMYASMGGSRGIPVFFIAHGVIVGILAGVAIAMVYAKKAAAPAQP